MSVREVSKNLAVEILQKYGSLAIMPLIFSMALALTCPHTNQFVRAETNFGKGKSRNRDHEIALNDILDVARSVLLVRNRVRSRT